MKKICKVSDCNNTTLAKNLCRKHYARLHRHGDENIILKPAGDCNAGFIINENGCHVWQGSLDSDGYARKHINGKTRRLCRVSLEKKLGRPILPGMMALHACNVWCYEQVCLAEMFKFSTNVIGKLAYSTCYALVADFNEEIKSKHRSSIYFFLCVGKN